MGKLILCSGVQAEHPFYFRLTETAVYSIEELCYYLYHNIYTITEDVFDDKLVNWLNNQVHMENIGEKLKVMMENQNSMKDIVVSILCSADYYTETEIKKLITIMDEINHRSPKEKQKIKADNYLKYGYYSMAGKEYELLLNGEFREMFTPEEYGDILHNLAIAHIHIASYQEAAIEFKEAYSRNHKKESLRQYLLALKLGKCEDEYKNEEMNFDKELVDSCMNEFDCIWLKAEETADYVAIEKLSNKKPHGYVSEYYQIIEEVISTWKRNYINEVS